MEKIAWHDLTLEELEEKAKTLKKELFNLRFQRVTGQVEKSSQFRMTRRNIARSLTFARMKKG